ncbi:MAG: penicillin-binding protein activator LpoB [Spirochaetaceae bacterium]|nr:penicillin-binding protein activator LpoB [Spirochaetaceae bacterium]
MKNFSLLAMIIAAAFILISCGPSTKVTRVASDEQIDLSGRWNDTDSQLVAREMISDAVNRPWANNFINQNKRNPVVIVGEVRNRSSEHIEVLVFTKSLERELINSGKVRFVASADERQGVRQERLDQQTEASAETMKRLGQETGADFYLGGVITSVTDALDKQRVVFYKTNLELIHIETNEKVWIGDKEIKKVIEQKKNKR